MNETDLTGSAAPFNSATRWTTVIKPGNRRLNFREVFQYKDLIGLFVRRDFVAIYKQTVLGPLWFVIQPLVTTVVFTVIFGNVAKITTQGVPHMLFYFAGNLMWHYFSATLLKISSTFEANAGVFGKVYFPRLTVPLSGLVTGLISFAIQFVVFVVLYAYYLAIQTAPSPNPAMFVLPLLLVQTAALSLGVGILISSWTTRYRDLKYLLSFGIRVWMYGTPIVYPLSIVPAKWRWALIANPMTSVVETFRKAYFGVGGVTNSELVISVGITVVILFLGLLSFGRIEKTFMDTI